MLSGSGALHQTTTLVIQKPLSGEESLAASSETADSSLGNSALRNDNSLGVFNLQNDKIF
jgi:hypothetical protein